VKRHKFDLIGMLFGLAFLAMGAGVMVHELSGNRVDPAWIASAGFVVLGAVALVATFVQRGDSEQPTSAVESEHPDPL